MTKQQFEIIINSVAASDVHKFYSTEAGFCAITSRHGRTVIRIEDSFSRAMEILSKENIKYHGKKTTNHDQ